VLGGEAHELAQEPPRALGSAGVAELAQRIGKARGEQAEDAIGGGAPERLLGLEVVGQRGQGDAGAPGDLAGGGALEAAGGEDRERGLEQTLAGLERALLGAPGAGAAPSNATAGCAPASSSTTPSSI
jgi:hypothetical protein